jgi:uncharacterized transporter YbjL
MAGGDAHAGEGQASQEVSDLIGAELTVAVMVWLLLAFAAFFFIGAVVGLIVVAVGVIGFGWFFVSAVRRADTPD